MLISCLVTRVHCKSIVVLPLQQFYTLVCMNTFSDSMTNQCHEYSLSSSKTSQYGSEVLGWQSNGPTKDRRSWNENLHSWVIFISHLLWSLNPVHHRHLLSSSTGVGRCWYKGIIKYLVTWRPSVSRLLFLQYWGNWGSFSTLLFALGI